MLRFMECDIALRATRRARAVGGGPADLGAVGPHEGLSRRSVERSSSAPSCVFGPSSDAGLAPAMQMYARSPLAQGSADSVSCTGSEPNSKSPPVASLGANYQKKGKRERQSELYPALTK